MATGEGLSSYLFISPEAASPVGRSLKPEALVVSRVKPYVQPGTHLPPCLPPSQVFPRSMQAVWICICAPCDAGAFYKWYSESAPGGLESRISVSRDQEETNKHARMPNPNERWSGCRVKEQTPSYYPVFWVEMVQRPGCKSWRWTPLPQKIQVLRHYLAWPQFPVCLD